MRPAEPPRRPPPPTSPPAIVVAAVPWHHCARGRAEGQCWMYRASLDVRHCRRRRNLRTGQLAGSSVSVSPSAVSLAVAQRRRDGATVEADSMNKLLTPPVPRSCSFTGSTTRATRSHHKPAALRAARHGLPPKIVPAINAHLEVGIRIDALANEPSQSVRHHSWQDPAGQERQAKPNDDEVPADVPWRWHKVPYRLAGKEDRN